MRAGSKKVEAVKRQDKELAEDPALDISTARQEMTRKKLETREDIGERSRLIEKDAPQTDPREPSKTDNESGHVEDL
jgi:hypothetical protein